MGIELGDMFHVCKDKTREGCGGMYLACAHDVTKKPTREEQDSQQSIEDATGHDNPI